MPREIVKKPRFIYPQIATSLSIAEVSAMAELLFWRILPQADDQGRLPGDPRQLKAMVCPMREELSIEKIPGLLDELEKVKLIIRYSNSSTSYIQIAKWWDYQGAMRRIFPSQYPPPEGWQDIVKGVSGGQPPTTADKQHPEEEEEVEEEPETGRGIRKQEEEGGKPATAAAETAKKTDSRKLTSANKGFGAETAEESKMLEFLETLEGWRFGRAEDLAWLRDFCQDRPNFGLSFAKACRDYHSGKPRVKHKGVWKNRFRNWMETEKKGKGGTSGADKQRPVQAKPAGKWDPSKPLR